MIWRRLVVPSVSTLADLHYAIQIAFAWTDYHLHRFRIRGKEYGIPRLGGPWYSRNARDIRLIDFHFRVNERFLYEYDFTDGFIASSTSPGAPSTSRATATSWP